METHIKHLLFLVISIVHGNQCPIWQLCVKQVSWPKRIKINSHELQCSVSRSPSLSKNTCSVPEDMRCQLDYCLFIILLFIYFNFILGRFTVCLDIRDVNPTKSKIKYIRPNQCMTTLCVFRLTLHICTSTTGCFFFTSKIIMQIFCTL